MFPIPSGAPLSDTLIKQLDELYRLRSEGKISADELLARKKALLSPKDSIPAPSSSAASTSAPAVSVSPHRAGKLQRRVGPRDANGSTAAESEASREEQPHRHGAPATSPPAGTKPPERTAQHVSASSQKTCPACSAANGPKDVWCQGCGWKLSQVPGRALAWGSKLKQGKGEAVGAQFKFHYYAPEKDQHQRQKAANGAINVSVELTDRRLLVSPSVLEASLMKANPVYWLTFGSTYMRNHTESIAIDYSSISRVYFLDYTSPWNTILSKIDFTGAADDQVKIAVETLDSSPQGGRTFYFNGRLAALSAFARRMSARGVQVVGLDRDSGAS